jgi:hypothetical protein
MANREGDMARKYKILILGASYGSLLGAKMAMAGHAVTLVCLPEEVQLINDEGARVRMAARGVDGLVELNTQTMPGKLSAAGPGDVNPADYDLIGLAMQEPQYGVPVLHEIKSSYTDASVWDNLDPALMTLCSPDPQAFRPPTEKINVLQVGLPTNFKAARFDSDEHTGVLNQLEEDIQAVRFDTGDREVELPVKLRVHDSIFVPLAKWSMLIAGNYRCVQKDGMRAIKDAVHTDIDATRAAYEWVVELCVSMGGSESDFVPFEKYSNAALSLVNPSSAARALANGAPNIERVDKMVQTIAAQNGMQSNSLDETVDLVDGWLEANRARA